MQEGARRQVEQRMGGRMEMNRDKASKQTGADENIMIDDGQQDRRERKPALY